MMEDSVDVEPTPYGYYSIAIDCRFEVDNTTYSPASIGATSGLFFRQEDYYARNFNEISVNVQPREIYIGYVPRYSGYGYAGNIFTVQDTITDVTSNQPNTVLSNSTTDPIVITATNNNDG